jgi:hypothetical protein
MNGVWKCVLTLSCVLALSVPASATVLTFEDLDPGYAAYGFVPAGYAGFAWGGDYGAYWITEDYHPVSGYHNVATMAPNSRMAIFTPGQSAMSMSDDAFTLNSLDIGAAWNDDQYVTVAGYLNGSLVDSDYFVAPVTGMTKSFDWGWVDTAWITPDLDTGVPHPGFEYGGAGCHFVAVDNIDYTAAPGLPAFVLVGAAPVVGGLVRRLRRK